MLPCQQQQLNQIVSGCSKWGIIEGYLVLQSKALQTSNSQQLTLRHLLAHAVDVGQQVPVASHLTLTAALYLQLLLSTGTRPAGNPIPALAARACQRALVQDEAWAK